jgi:hypothetical protein
MYPYWKNITTELCNKLVLQLWSLKYWYKAEVYFKGSEKQIRRYRTHRLLWRLNITKSILLIWRCYLVTSSSSSSSRSWRVRRFSCSLILKVVLVPPSLLRSSHVPSSFRSVFQCLSWYSICVYPLYVLQPLFLVLFYSLYYVLCW